MRKLEPLRTGVGANDPKYFSPSAERLFEFVRRSWWKLPVLVFAGIVGITCYWMYRVGHAVHAGGLSASLFYEMASQGEYGALVSKGLLSPGLLKQVTEQDRSLGKVKSFQIENVRPVGSYRWEAQVSVHRDHGNYTEEIFGIEDTIEEIESKKSSDKSRVVGDHSPE